MINGELVVDNFAGGGGASTGMEMATGYSVDIAINHDPEAIKMHKMNHPDTKHYCESVWDVDPIEACNGHPVAIAWFSPDCKHFSKAKGGKPKDKNIRGLAWVALRWAGKVRPRVIMLENVEEFKTWGPLNRRHRPIKSKQGQTFNKFISQLEELGYEVQHRELVAADYGTPTMRKRFFLIARCDGKPIVWPKPTHGPADSKEVKAGLLKPYIGAYTQLDFSLPCPSIFDTAEEIKEKYGIRAVRPLAPKTMERIARGLKKFVIDNAEPFIVQVNHSGAKSDYCKSTNEPLSTVTAKHGFGVVEPYLVQCKYNNEAQDVAKPLGTVTTVGSHLLVEPKLEPCNVDLETIDGYADCTDVNELKHWKEELEPKGVTFEEYFGYIPNSQFAFENPIAAPYIEVNRSDRPGNSVEEPLCTVTGVNQHCLIEPKLAPFMGVNTTNHPGGKADEPLHTITTGGQQCLISPTLIQYHSETSENEVRGQVLENPIMTVDGSNRYGLVMSFLSKFYKTGTGQDVREPLHTVTTSAGHFGEVRAFLIKYYGDATGQDINNPLDTVTTKDRFGLVTIQGVDYQIVDIGLRMLEPKELYGCQGFPDDYIIDRDIDGKPYSRTEQVKRCGNAVCPPIPAALVKANLPEICVATRTPNMRITEEATGQLRLA